jgi:uncharacterized protein YeaO (DUF488 family)
MYALMIKCAYEKPSKSDGFRILIDRLWPRGLQKEEAKIDLWLKEIAPSTALRKWFNHEADKWMEFQHVYAKELKKRHALVNAIIAELHKHPVSLIYSEKDPELNHTIVLCKQLQYQLLKQIH